MNQNKKGFVNLQKGDQLLPQPEMLELKKQKAQITIGVPREVSFQENRIGLVPEAVAMLVNHGHQVIVESNAGRAAHFNDDEYIDAGANLVYNPVDVFQADLIIKVAPPVTAEIERMKPRSALFSAVHLTGQKEEYFRKLISRKLTAISYEHFKDKTDSYPVIRSLSEIAGNMAVFTAAEYLSNTEFGKGKSFGGFSGITPVEVVIIGAGTVAEFAARSALGMGAEVKIFDNSVFKLRSIQNKLNTRLFTSIIQHKVLAKALRSADVLIGAIHNSEESVPVVVTEDMVKEMPYGSVIVDISIVGGGCCETSRATTHSNPVYKKHGVTHYCVPNISSRVPHTASFALSNFFTPIILRIGEEGGVDHFLRTEPGARCGTYLYNGILTNKYISDLFGIPFQDIELLMFPIS